MQNKTLNFNVNQPQKPKVNPKSILSFVDRFQIPVTESVGEVKKLVDSAASDLVAVHQVTPNGAKLGYFDKTKLLAILQA